MWELQDMSTDIFPRIMTPTGRGATQLQVRLDNLPKPWTLVDIYSSGEMVEKKFFRVEDAVKSAEALTGYEIGGKVMDHFWDAIYLYLEKQGRDKEFNLIVEEMPDGTARRQHLGYPFYYETWNGTVICPDCALRDQKDPEPEYDDDRALFQKPNWEIPNLECHLCGNRIESAYAEEDDDE